MIDGLPEVIEYTDELHDEFSTAKIETPVIDGDYDYLRLSFGGKAHSFFAMLIGKPIAYLYLKCKFHHKIVGREKLKENRGKPMFLYGNHTQIIGDALIPVFVTRGHRFKVIVHPNNIKAPVIGSHVPYFGGLPLPTGLAAARHFMEAVSWSVRNDRAVVIYPEAHLWPYYTGIRPFPDDSFGYPVQFRTAVYCFTNTYHRRANPHKVKIITYVDGPFYPDPKKNFRENKQYLRNACHDAMQKRAETSDCCLIQYVKKEKTDD